MEGLNANGYRVSLLNNDAPPAEASSPTTRHLMRSGPYHDETGHRNIDLSPLVASLDFTYNPAPPQPSTHSSNTKRSLDYDSSRCTYGDDAPVAAQGPATKRYLCRFRDSHGCAITFTSSGHASRHAKIHSAKKVIQCTFPGCQKHFTRADNMKQHLETHLKDKPRKTDGSHHIYRSALSGDDHPVSATRFSSSSFSCTELDAPVYTASPLL